jgi:pyrroline-5-carboxylate reductase
MGYTLCVLGCGTMGVAILSGVVASLTPSVSSAAPNKWEIHTPGTRTPVVSDDNTGDPALPARFLACVSREESGRRLRGVFANLGGLGGGVEVVVGQNVQAVAAADVVLLWRVPQSYRGPTSKLTSKNVIVASRSWRMPF